MNQDKNQQLNSERMYEDCYYFLYSSCRRGAACIYRHSQEAKSSTKLCPEWEKTKTCTLTCPLRHSFYHLQKKRSNDLCYFEETPQGCTKAYCEYKHKDVTRDAWKSEMDGAMAQNDKRFGEYSLDLDKSSANAPNAFANNKQFNNSENNNKVTTAYQEYDHSATNNKFNNFPKQEDYFLQKGQIPLETNQMVKKSTTPVSIANPAAEKSIDLTNHEQVYYENLKFENNSIMGEIKQIQNEIIQADKFLASIKRRF